VQSLFKKRPANAPKEDLMDEGPPQDSIFALPVLMP
jgi:hypothetical protein